MSLYFVHFLPQSAAKLSKLEDYNSAYRMIEKFSDESDKR